MTSKLSTKEKLELRVQELTAANRSLEQRIKDLTLEIDRLKDRPSSNGTYPQELTTGIRTITPDHPDV